MKLYGCHNRKPSFEPIVAQSGWFEFHDDVSIARIPIYVRIEHTMSRDCRYDRSATDSQCTGCEHRTSGEIGKGCDA